MELILAIIALSIFWLGVGSIVVVTEYKDQPRYVRVVVLLIWPLIAIYQIVRDFVKDIYQAVK